MYNIPSYQKNCDDDEDHTLSSEQHHKTCIFPFSVPSYWWRVIRLHPPYSNQSSSWSGCRLKIQIQNTCTHKKCGIFFTMCGEINLWSSKSILGYTKSISSNASPATLKQTIPWNSNRIKTNPYFFFDLSLFLTSLMASFCIPVSSLV